MANSVQALFNDPTYRSLELSMDAAAKRHAAIAQNIANINTPGYKRVDLSAGFEKAMQNAFQQLDQTGTTGALPTPSIAEAEVQGLARQDGNTVSVEKEMIEMAQNQSRFDFSAQLAAKKFRMIRMAVTGKG